MSKLQVLVATMGQTDLSLIEKMNIKCDAIIANQSDTDAIVVTDRVKMITTATKGVGLNRNIAMLASDAELLLFADDDVVYYDNMPQMVSNAFVQRPDADVIIFGMDITRNGVITEKRRVRNGRLWVWNSMRYGMVRIAIRRSALLRANIAFNQNFGGGCPFSAGEDSLFLKACFDAHLKVYGNSNVLCQCAKDTSTWFVGYNEKYFYDKGVLLRYLFPKIPGLYALYFGICFKRETELNVFARLRYIFAGIRGGKTLLTYKDVYEKTEAHYRQ